VIQFSSFNYIALLHCTLANVSMPRSRGRETVGGVVRRQLPWMIEVEGILLHV
jgi:hypothetical protein